MTEREDRELDDYLRGGSPLSAAYRGERGEAPSPDLDEVLLERARREVHLGPKVAWSPFTRSWSLPLALAAVLVVSVTVTLVRHEQTGEPLPVPAKPAADGLVVVPAPGPERKDAPAAAPAAVAPKAAPERARAPVPPAPFPAERAAPPGREQRPAAAGAAAPAPVQQDASREQPAAAPAGEAVPAAPRPETKAAPALRAKQELAKEQDLGPDPEAWLKRIEALRREGRHAEADALLAEFRKRFPDYPADRFPK